MPVVQSTYATRHDAAREGLVANMEVSNIVSRLVETAAIGFGKIVVQGVADQGIRAPAAATATPAAKAGGNTGNGALTMDATAPIGRGVKPGIYVVRCIVAATNGGTFRIEDPDGTVLGDVAVGATFDDDLKFVIADGSTDFIVGDGFDITVAAPASTQVVGITVRDVALAPERNDQYAIGDTAGVLTKGVIWVVNAGGVVAGDAAHFLPSSGALSKPGVGTIAIPGGRFDTSGANGALVQLRIG